MLQQAKKKAALRVKGGRAKPIDWLAVTLRFIDPEEDNILDEEIENHDLDVVDPEGVLEGLSNENLSELEKEIENYLTLESNRSNRDYWTVSWIHPFLVLSLTMSVPQSNLQRPSSKIEILCCRSPWRQLRCG